MYIRIHDLAYADGYVRIQWRVEVAVENGGRGFGQSGILDVLYKWQAALYSWTTVRPTN